MRSVMLVSPSLAAPAKQLRDTHASSLAMQAQPGGSLTGRIHVVVMDIEDVEIRNSLGA